jgi:hypothetical protein
VNVRVYVGPSHIAGQGLFAGQDIKKDTKIIPVVSRKPVSTMMNYKPTPCKGT